MTQLERAILQHIRQLDADGQQRVLDFVTQLAARRRLSAREIMQLVPHERQQIVQSALQAAADEDFEIFEAYRDDANDD